MGLGRVRILRESMMADLCYSLRNRTWRVRAGSSSVLVEGDDLEVSRSRCWLRCDSYICALDSIANGLMDEWTVCYQPCWRWDIEWSNECVAKCRILTFPS